MPYSGANFSILSISISPNAGGAVLSFAGSPRRHSSERSTGPIDTDGRQRFTTTAAASFALQEAFPLALHEDGDEYQGGGDRGQDRQHHEPYRQGAF